METATAVEQITTETPVQKSQPISQAWQIIIAITINTTITILTIIGLGIGIFSFIQSSNSNLRSEFRNEIQSLEDKVDRIDERLDDLFIYLLENGDSSGGSNE